jgi:ribosomal protein RSM22 (predicted rRNA methylase)
MRHLVLPEWAVSKLQDGLRSKKGAAFTANQLARAADELIQELRREQNTHRDTDLSEAEAEKEGGARAPWRKGRRRRRSRATMGIGDEEDGYEYDGGIFAPPPRPPSGWKHVLGGRNQNKTSFGAAHLLLRGPATFAATHHALTQGLGLTNEREEEGLEEEEGVMKTATESVDKEPPAASSSAVHHLRVLDYGAGCGLSSLALMEVLEPSSGLIKEEGVHEGRGPAVQFQVDAVEPSAALHRIGTQVLPEAFWYRDLKTWYKVNVTRNSDHDHNDQQERRRRRGGRKGSALIDGDPLRSRSSSKSPYDVALVVFALSELGSEAEVEEHLQKVWRSIKSGGVLCCVEPGTPSGAKLMQKVRKWALQQQQQQRRSSSSSRILAPCTHQHACPMSSSSSSSSRKEWCHFVQSYAKTEALKGTLKFLSPATHWTNYKEARSPRLKRSMGDHFLEKFSYLVVQKMHGENEEEEVSQSALPLLAPRLRLGDRDGGGGGMVNASRIVATPKKRGKHLLLRLCREQDDEEEEQGPPAAGASVDQVVVTKSNSEYVKLKSSKWGDRLNLL